MTRIAIDPFQTGTVTEQLEWSEALWRRVAASPEITPVVRWYGYGLPYARTPAVVLGAAQDRSAVDEAACRQAGVDVVKRASGGAAVYVDESTLALDVALPAAHPLAGHDVVRAYRWLGAAFAAALRRVAPAITGVPAGAPHRAAGPGCISLVGVAQARADQQARRAAPEGSPAALRSLTCFGTLSPYEVALAHAAEPTLRKLVGLSQVRKRGVVLYQAGVYTRHSGAHLASVLALPADSKERLAAELDRRVASLEEIGLRHEDLPELMATFNREAAARLSSATTDGCR